MFMLTGTGGNGKGVYLNVILALLQVVISHFCHSNALAQCTLRT
jgi:hypothetical protein